MKYKFITYFLKISLILAIGLVSLGVVAIRTPSKIALAQGDMTASMYGISFYTKSGEVFLIGPLNDFYYNGLSKNHLLEKVVSNKPEGSVQEIFLSIKDLFSNEQHLIIKFEGKNLEGDGSITYTIQYKNNRVELTREIVFKKTTLTALGQTINICNGCLVIDPKNRVYFNQEFLTDEKVNLALKLKLTPLILTENQFFPNDVSEIMVINSRGETKMTIPANNNLIFLQERWNQLEFRTPVKPGKSTIIKQIIDL